MGAACDLEELVSGHECGDQSLLEPCVAHRDEGPLQGKRLGEPMLKSLHQLEATQCLWKPVKTHT